MTDVSSIPEPGLPPIDGWEFQFIERVNSGLAVDKRASALTAGEALIADNIRFEKQTVFVDLGYKTFGQPVVGNPRASYQFFLSNGSSILTLITNSTFYVWNQAVVEWQLPSDGVKTTLRVGEVTNNIVIDVNDITGFSIGDLVGVTLDNGKQHQVVIENITPSTPPTGGFNIASNPFPSNAAIGNAVVKAATLNGTDDIGVSIETWAAVDRMYFANGVNTPKQFDGIDVTNISNLPGTTFSCRVVSVFEGALHLMHTIEDGTTFPQRVRFSETGDPTSWNALVNFQDLYDTEDFIITAERLGPYHIIYKERSIIREGFVGAPDKRYDFKTTITAEGAIAVDSVVNLGDTHIFFGNANVYEYKGGFNIKPIGDPIFDKVFGNFGELNPSALSTVFGVYVEETDEIWFFYPAGTDAKPRNMLKLKLTTNAWSARKFGIFLTGFGFFQSQGQETWQSATGTWAGQNYTWNSKSVQANSPTLHLLADNKQVYEYDYIAEDDNGTPIPYEFQTGDFFIPNSKMRFNRYIFYLKGNNVTISASYDQGKSWVTLKVASPGSVFKEVVTFRQKVSKFVRFRFTGNQSFGLEWLGFQLKRESFW